MPAGASGAGDANSFTPAIVQGLPEAARQIMISGYNDALTPVFLYTVPLTVRPGGKHPLVASLVDARIQLCCF